MTDEVITLKEEKRTGDNPFLIRFNVYSETKLIGSLALHVPNGRRNEALIRASKITTLLNESDVICDCFDKLDPHAAKEAIMQIIRTLDRASALSIRGAVNARIRTIIKETSNDR